MWKFLAFILALILVVALGLLFTQWEYNAVIGSDLPDWLKYAILRG